MNEIKISVIIPVYNVKNYLKDTINSLLINNMESIEIILVDDGSTDGSQILCNCLSKKFKFIKVLHKKNGGLSSARNLGIRYSHGKWLCFIDSDDLVVKNYLNIIKKITKNTSADLIMFFYKTFQDGLKNNLDYKEFNMNNLNYISKEKAMGYLLNEKIGNYAWNKVYKRSLFKNIKYPEGKYYEDIFTTYKLIANTKSISLYKDSLYLYRQRKGSIINPREKKNLELSFDNRWEAQFKQLLFFKRNYPDVYKASLDELFNFSIIFVIYYDNFSWKNKIIYENANKFIEEYSNRTFKNINLKNKIIILLKNHFSMIYRIIIKYWFKIKESK